MAFGQAMLLETNWFGTVYMGEPPKGLLEAQPRPTMQETAKLRPRYREHLLEHGWAGHVAIATERSPQDGQFWVILSKDRTQFYGITDVFRDPDTPHPHDLQTRIVLRTDAQGKRLGQEARIARLYAAFNLAPQMGALAVYAGAHESNIGSIKGILRLGGVRTSYDASEGRSHFATVNPLFAEDYLQAATANKLITPDLHDAFRAAQSTVQEVLAVAAMRITLLTQPDAPAVS